MKEQEIASTNEHGGHRADDDQYMATGPTPDRMPVPLDGWTADCYDNLVRHGDDGGPPESVRKLATSAVAPLIAAGRGYIGFQNATRDGAKDACIELGLSDDLRQKASGMVATSIKRGGMLAIPWFSIGEVAASRRFDRVELPDPQTWQLRAVRPLLDSAGRDKGKYLALPGRPLPLDIHPATPASWIANPAAILITEGVPKGDAALSGLLRRLFTEEVFDQLSECSEERYYPLQELHELMAAVPQKERVLIVSLAGVANWHHHSHDWNSIGTRGVRVFVAFDGDVAENPHVHRQATALWRFLSDTRGANPVMLDLAVATEGPAGEAPLIAKIGVDDFLASVGKWDDLLATQRPDLPPAPDSAAVSDWTGWVMRFDTLNCVERIDVYDDAGNYVRTIEKQVVGLCGRLTTISERRELTEAIELSGRVPPLTQSTDGSEAGAAIEVAWLDEAGVPHRFTITGPARLMSEPPANWSRIANVYVPPQVQAHPDWPPSPKWLASAKQAGFADRNEELCWRQQGWVPTSESGDTWVFAVGNSAATPTGVVDDAPWAPLAEADAPHLGDYGLAQPRSTRASLAYNASEVLDGLGAIWSDEAVSAAALAMALRPVAPIHPRVPQFASGARGVGKSSYASVVMSGYQPEPGRWTEHNLPGSANDTVASMEYYTSMLPIWVTDDLAPSEDRYIATRVAGAVEANVRASFNNASKRRMHAGQDGVVAARVNRPLAAIIITGENTLDIASAMDRTFEVRLGPDVIRTTADPDHPYANRVGHEALKELRDRSGAVGHLVADVAVRLAKEIADSGWVSVRKRAHWLCQEHESHVVKTYLGGDDRQRRTAKVVADVALGILLLRQQLLLEEGPLATKTVERIDRSLDVLALSAVRNREARAQLTPGAALVGALRTALTSGQAHITSPQGRDPHTGSVSNLSLLGWRFAPAGSPEHDVFRPNGRRIGSLHVRDGVRYVCFDPEAAFAAAQTAAPRLLPPGTKAPDGWRAVWAEHLAGGWKRKSDSHYVARVKGAGEVVPVPLDLILNHQDEDQRTEKSSPQGQSVDDVDHWEHIPNEEWPADEGPDGTIEWPDEDPLLLRIENSELDLPED